YVSPDPDLVTFWLGDRIDERGWGLAGDTFNVMDGLRALDVDVWFNLGDQDLAIGIERARRLRQGDRLTDAQKAIADALGVPSTGPILAIPGLHAALGDTRAPVVAVSPLVGGEVIKGPTAAFMEFTGLPLTSDGIAAYYNGMIDGLVADQRARWIPTLETDVLM